MYPRVSAGSSPAVGPILLGYPIKKMAWDAWDIVAFSVKYGHTNVHLAILGPLHEADCRLDTLDAESLIPGTVQVQTLDARLMPPGAMQRSSRI